MKVRLHSTVLLASLALVLALVTAGQGKAAEPSAPLTVPQAPSFSYTGRLNLANNSYDMQFRLFNAETGGTLAGSPGTVVVESVQVTNLQYTVDLNFGPAAFPGDARWLEVGYRSATSGGAFSVLAIRKPILPTAYARSLRPGAQIVGSTATGDAILTSSNTGTGVAFWGKSVANAAVYGESTNSTGVLGQGAVVGVRGRTNGGAGIGVRGDATSNAGVYGESTNSTGVLGVGGFIGVRGRSTSGTGVYGESTNGYAGFFNGKTATKVLEIQGGSDLAERFDVADDAQIEPGTLMAIDERHPGKLKISDEPYDAKVAGIVSGAGGVRPGLTLHQAGVMEGKHVVAIAGRVYVKSRRKYWADQARRPPYDIGTPGYAMRVVDRERADGAVIGKAMTALDHGTGLVLVLVNLQ